MELETSNILIKINILDNLSEEKNMEKEITFLVKELFLVEDGNKIKKLKVNLLFLMEMYLMDVLKTINVTKVNIVTETEMSTKVHGKMMLKMDLENFIYKMGKSMKEDLLKVRNMEKVFTLGKMVIDMKGNLHMIKDKGLANIIGMMVDFTKENGKLIE